MQIRAACTADIPALARLNETVQALHAAAHPTLFKAAPEVGALAGWFAEVLAKPDAWVLVGEVAGTPVGYIAGEVIRYPENPFRYPLTFGLIDQLAVVAEAQRRGYGERLLDALLERFRAADVARVELTVWAFNAGARRFYERHGFTTAIERLSRDLAPAAT